MEKKKRGRPPKIKIEDKKPKIKKEPLPAEGAKVFGTPIERPAPAAVASGSAKMPDVPTEIIVGGVLVVAAYMFLNRKAAAAPRGKLAAVTPIDNNPFIRVRG